MIFISHRGNVSQREINSENNPDYLMEALHKGFDVEMDIWFSKGKWLLGHDSPEYEVTFSWISSSSKFWLHCKNIDAFIEIHNISIKSKRKFNFFWHDKDKFTLTSKSFIWANVGIDLNYLGKVLCGPYGDFVFSRKVLCGSRAIFVCVLYW